MALHVLALVLFWLSVSDLLGISVEAKGHDTSVPYVEH